MANPFCNHVLRVPLLARCCRFSISAVRSDLRARPDHFYSVRDFRILTHTRQHKPKWTLLPARTCGLLYVEVPGGPNVPHDRTCSCRARQFVPARASLRATDPARWIGRGGQFADQRRAVWSCQSQGPLGPQRHRKCLKSAAAPQQHPGTRGHLNTDGTDTGRHAAFLSERVAADHRHDCCKAEKQGTASPARSPAG